MKYLDVAVVMSEIPDEISLAIEITNCPHKCPDCHSSQLREDIGTELTVEKVYKLINKYSYCSCILFMGGDAYHDEIIDLCKQLRVRFKMAMYSGDDVIDPKLIPYLDYYKIGSFQRDKGPLNKKTTNQRLYKIVNEELIDMTSIMYRNDVSEQ